MPAYLLAYRDEMNVRLGLEEDTVLHGHRRRLDDEDYSDLFVPRVGERVLLDGVVDEDGKPLAVPYVNRVVAVEHLFTTDGLDDHGRRYNTKPGIWVYIAPEDSDDA
jgi:hypothetical protein